MRPSNNQFLNELPETSNTVVFNQKKNLPQLSENSESAVMFVMLSITREYTFLNQNCSGHEKLSFPTKYCILQRIELSTTRILVGGFSYTIICGLIKENYLVMKNFLDLCR